MILSFISILAIALTVFIYRRQPVQLVLRSAAIGLMYLLISHYTVVVGRTGRANDPVVLIDHSRSMESHLNRVREAVASLAFPHRVVYFNDNELLSAEPESLGSFTNLTRALEAAYRMEPAAVLVVTDGNHNFGASPLTLPDLTKIPLRIYGAGEDTVRDASIVGITAPSCAFQGDSVQIDVIVGSSGFASGEGRVVLGLSPDAPLAMRDFPLSDAPAQNTVRFRIAPAATGTARYHVNIEPLPGEASYDNNRSAVTLDVLKERIKVICYTDHLSFNAKFIRAALAGDSGLSVSSFYRYGADRYRRAGSEEDIPALPDLNGFDVLILIDVDLTRLPWPNVLGSIARGQGAALTGTISGVSDAWRMALPISIAGGTVEGEHALRIDEPFSILNRTEPPPVRRVSRAAGARAGATIVARVDELPVIGYCDHEQGRIFQISILDLGTWDFLQRGLMNQEMLRRFMGDVARFLSPLGEHERLRLIARQADCAVGELVTLQLQSHDRDLRPQGGGDFTLVAGSAMTPCYETSPGQYEATIVFETEGRPRLFAQGELDGERLTSNTIEMNVMPAAREGERRMNQALLQAIASASGGEFHRLDELGRSAAPGDRPRTGAAIDIDAPVTYFLIFIALAADWILRRRRGIT